MRHRFKIWLGVALLVVMGAAGGNAQTKSQTEHATVVVIKNFAFTPSDVTVKAGTTVEWRNEDIVPHTVSAADHSFRSGNIAPGKTWKFVPSKSGVFDYNCSPHPNMHGKLTVK